MLRDIDIWTIARRRTPTQLTLACIVTATVLAVAVSHLFWYLLTGSVPDGLTIVAGGAAIVVALPMVLVFVKSVYQLQAANQRLFKTKTHLSFNNEELAVARNDLSKLNRELERRVTLRTADLEKALKAAEEANAAKTIFLANMSHELRTPLNGIIGYSEMIAKRNILFPDIPAEKIDEYARAIFSSGHHLHAMVSDLLDLSKIEFEQLNIALAPLAVAKTVQNAVIELLPMAEARNQKLNVILPADDAVFITDQRATHQIVTNLLSNALKYSADGETITVSAACSGTTTSFVVTDNGIGMSPDAISKATQPFSKFSDAHIASGDSVGLGLSIVNKLCKALGGKLTLESVERSGTTARVDFPESTLQTATPPATQLALAG